MDCQKQIHNNIPALRFPDFQNDGDWEMKRLGDVCDLTNGMAFKPSDWKTKGVPIVRIQNLNDEKAEFNYCDPEIINEKCMIDTGTLLFSWSGTPGTSFGAFIWNRGKAVLNQHIFIVEPIDIDKLFLKVSIDANMASIIEKTHGGAGLRHITKSDFEDVCVFVPKGITEQRRIAACLSVLDEMLAATNDKLEQLKAYKKGLMQKLFPAKGKKLPELRFKEFEKDGEWEVKKLGEIITTLSPTKKLQSGKYKAVGSFPIVDQSQNYICGYSDDVEAVVNTTSENLIVFGDHTCTLKFVDFPFIQGADGIKIFKSSKSNEIDERFLYQALLYNPIISKEYKRHFSELKEQVVCYPIDMNEQRKIASCLSSMDDQINAYLEKVALLEQYKKGLMQQMFPTSK